MYALEITLCVILQEKGSRVLSLQYSTGTTSTDGRLECVFWLLLFKYTSFFLCHKNELETAENSCEIYWKTSYNGTQRVLQVFDDLDQYNRVLKVGKKSWIR